MDDSDEYYEDGEFCSCPRCQGDGFVNCHCGGDLCVCENYGDAPCPVCHGEGEVTAERYDEYLKARAEAWKAFREAEVGAE